MRVMRQGTDPPGTLPQRERARNDGADGGTRRLRAGASAGTRQAPARPQGKVYHMSRADPYILDLFKEQARAFTAEHPDVQVEIDHQEQAAWLEKFKTMVASESPLDTAFANDSNDVLFARDGLVADLDPFLARQKDFKEADFAEGSWFAMRFQGKRFGLPWDEQRLRAVLQSRPVRHGRRPVPRPQEATHLGRAAGDRPPADPGRQRPAPQRGGLRSRRRPPVRLRHQPHLRAGQLRLRQRRRDADRRGQGGVGRPQAIEAIQFLADLRSRHYVWSAPQLAAQPIGFRTNNLAIDHNGAWNLGRYAQDVQRVESRQAPFKRRPASGGHYSPLVLTRHAQNRSAAWAWMYFACLSETGQGMLSDAGQMQPNRLSLAQRFVNAPGGKVEGKYRQVLIDEMTGGALRVPGDRVGTYWAAIPDRGPVLTPLLTPVWRGEVSAAQAMPEIRRLTEQYLQTGRAAGDQPALTEGIPRRPTRRGRATRSARRPAA